MDEKSPRKPPVLLPEPPLHVCPLHAWGHPSSGPTGHPSFVPVGPCGHPLFLARRPSTAAPILYSPWPVVFAPILCRSLGRLFLFGGE